MRAIILAAGRGSRLQSAHPRPKCLLEFGGRTLLERHLTILADHGVDDVVLAVGFEPKPIVDELERLGRRDDVEIVVNADYTLGSVLTVHTTAAAMTRGGDVLLMDADVLYDPAIIARLVADAQANRLLIDRGFEPGDEPVKVCLANGVPVEFRKRVADGLAYDTIGESVGFFRFTEDTARRFATIVAGYVDAGRADQPHEEAIRDLLLERTHPFDVADATGLPWIEIDFPADVIRAETAVLPRIEAARQERAALEKT